MEVYILKSEIRENIEQLDVEYGGGIISEKIRVDTIDNPMLVIGLGGTGIDALLRLKYQVNRRFNLPEDPLTKRKAEKPNNIEFLAFETNLNDSNKKYMGIGLDLNSELVMLSNAEIGGILRNPSTIEPCIKEWLSPDLSAIDGINGAGGIRQAGRLLLFTKIIQVIGIIEKKINTLMTGTNKKLIVFIITGLSGGTGSGCFLDIAYIVRGIMEKRFASLGKLDILGYLFMPDVNLSKTDISTHTEDYIKKNGYAALKELDYWMNIGERKEWFEQNYRDILEVKSSMPPFNQCHLISATNARGKKLENAYDYCMNVTAENITNFMTNEEKQSGDEFAIHDYMSNINKNIDNMIKPYSANYIYNIIGASSAVLPIEEITTFLAYKLFKKIESMFGATPSEQDVDDFIRLIRIDEKSIDMRFKEGLPEPLPGYQHSERFSYANVIKTQIVNLDNELQKYIDKARTEFIKKSKQLPDVVLTEFSEKMTLMFKDVSKGPFYVSRLINNNKGFCILRTLRAIVDSLDIKLKRIATDIDNCRFRANEEMGIARKAIINKDKKKNDYIRAKIEEYTVRAYEEQIKYMLEFYTMLYDGINNQNSKIYGVFTEILNVLNDIFEKNADILVESREITSQGNKTYYWNVVSIPEIMNKINEIVDEKSEEELIADFTNVLLDKSDKWINEQNVDIADSIGKFLTEKFDKLISKSMDDYISIKYEKKGQSERVDKLVERDIASRLNEDAVPLFDLSNSDSGLNLPSWGLVSVPMKSPLILKGIENYKANSIDSSRFSIRKSKVTNRIFWLNTYNGVPLYAYTPINYYEKEYERTIFEKEGIGRHLVQNIDNNWVFLPSPIPEKSWGDTYFNERISKVIKDTKQLFDRAMEQKSIRINGSDGRYQCYITKSFDIEEFMSRYNIIKENNDMNFTEINRCLGDLKEIMDKGLEVIEIKDIFGTANKDLKTAAENFYRCPQLVNAMKAEAEKYYSIETKISDLESIIEKVKEENEILDRFFDALITDTIYKKGTLYVYDREIEEDEWDSFVNLMMVKEYPEFVMFKKYKGLDKRKRSILDKKSGKRIMSGSIDVEGLLEKLNNMVANYASYKEKLDYDKDSIPNGEEIYDFYKKGLISLKNRKEILNK